MVTFSSPWAPHNVMSEAHEAGADLRAVEQPLLPIMPYSSVPNTILYIISIYKNIVYHILSYI